MSGIHAVDLIRDVGAVIAQVQEKAVHNINTEESANLMKDTLSEGS